MYWNTGSGKEIAARAIKQRGGGVTNGKKGDAGGGAEDSSGETGYSGGRAVALDGETVDSGSAPGILDGQPGAGASVIEIRAERWGSRRWNGEFSSGTGSSSDETRDSGNGPGLASG